MPYEPVIGLEVHAQLSTESKIFSSVSTTFGAAPNSQVSPVCAGLPGVLPVLNRKAVEFAIKMGLATNCKIAPFSLFARKHYFYPDLPKGYQISQYEEPLCEHGWLDLELENGTHKRVRIIRIHLEEDAGKSIHAEEFVAENETLIDLNRCGVPLIEIVSGPDIASPREANRYLASMQKLVRYLGICDGNMEEGSLRCDANVSVRPVGHKEFGTKIEIKNMNSIRHVERALEAEIQRQIDILENGGTIAQETRLWDASRGVTISMRSKEFEHDYRYFPEPDLAPLRVEEEWRERVKASLPELPQARRNRFIEEYKLSRPHAEVLTEERDIADYFEGVARHVSDAKQAANWVMGEVLRVLSDEKIEISAFNLPPQALAEMITLIEQGAINNKVAREVFEQMRATGKSAREIVKEKGLEQVSDAGVIEKAIADVLAAHPEEVARYRAGEQKVFGFLVGQLMKATRGKVNPQMANQVLREKLE
ncbi:Asp-tRNA(Asn)/Glu-tRNA(Gln) amidotransferase GatCAB subunit B [candidate division KSB1 bacterium]|nr:MAG: Asp-tRNA(Asn)/Glu-tRNA(Gln) amidotransferase GatCAB subunit B [candidate division KSB1 bacterium]